MIVFSAKKLDGFFAPRHGGQSWGTPTSSQRPRRKKPHRFQSERSPPVLGGPSQDLCEVVNNHELWDPFHMVFLWLLNGGDPNHLLTGMILQLEAVDVSDIGKENLLISPLFNNSPMDLLGEKKYLSWSPPLIDFCTHASKGIFSYTEALRSLYRDNLVFLNLGEHLSHAHKLWKLEA